MWKNKNSVRPFKDIVIQENKLYDPEDYPDIKVSDIRIPAKKVDTADLTEGKPDYEDAVACIAVYQRQAAVLTEVERLNLKEIITSGRFLRGKYSRSAMTNHFLYKKFVFTKYDTEYLTWASYLVLRAMYGNGVTAKYLDKVRAKFGTVDIKDHSNEFYFMHPNAIRYMINIPAITNEQKTPQTSEDDRDSFSDILSNLKEDKDDESKEPIITGHKRKIARNLEPEKGSKRPKQDERTPEVGIKNKEGRSGTKQTVEKMQKPLTMSERKDSIPQKAITSLPGQKSSDPEGRTIKVNSILENVTRQPHTPTPAFPPQMKTSATSVAMKKPTSSSTDKQKTPASSEMDIRVEESENEGWQQVMMFRRGTPVKSIREMAEDITKMKSDISQVVKMLTNIQEEIAQVRENGGRTTSDLQTVLTGFAEAIRSLLTQNEEEITREQSQVEDMEEDLDLKQFQDDLFQEVWEGLKDN